MSFKAKCQICGKEYDSYMRTYYVQYSEDETDRKCCCRQCLPLEQAKKPHRYINHIPMFCDGGDLVTRLFDTREEMLKWIRQNINTSDSSQLCCDDGGAIVVVNTLKKHWLVCGFSTACKNDFPDWKETVIKHHGSI